MRRRLLFNLRRTWPIVAIVMAALCDAQGAQRSFDMLVEMVIRQGADAQLPSHLSVVLGVSRLEQKTDVKQAVIRVAGMIKTFNVCKINHADVVILTYDEQSQSTKAYLMSPSGALRKAVDYQTGGAANERSLAAARGDFAVELKFWAAFSDKSIRVGPHLPSGG